MALIVPDAGEFAAPAAPEVGLTLAGAAPWRRLESLATVARAGFQRVELGGASGELGDPQRLQGLGRRELLRALREAELVPAAVQSAAVVGLAQRGRRAEEKSALQRSVELAEALGAPVVVLRGGCAAGGEEAARYALDTLYDVEQMLQETGVALALEAGGRADDLLAVPESRRVLVAEAPQAVGIGLDVADLRGGALGPRAVAALAPRARWARLAATAERAAGLVLDSMDESQTMLCDLGSAGYGGSLGVRVPGEGADRASLADLHRRLVAFVPQALGLRG
jgi:hypothetical protein